MRHKKTLRIRKKRHYFLNYLLYLLILSNALGKTTWLTKVTKFSIAFTSNRKWLRSLSRSWTLIRSVIRKKHNFKNTYVSLLIQCLKIFQMLTDSVSVSQWELPIYVSWATYTCVRDGLLSIFMKKLFYHNINIPIPITESVCYELSPIICVACTRTWSSCVLVKSIRFYVLVIAGIL